MVCTQDSLANILPCADRIGRLMAAEGEYDGTKIAFFV